MDSKLGLVLAGGGGNAFFRIGVWANAKPRIELGYNDYKTIYASSLQELL